MAHSKAFEKLPSGKYKGWFVSQVPSDYIHWVETYCKDSSLYNWLHGIKKSPKAKKRHKQVGGNQPAQGAKTGPVHSSKVFRVRTNADGTTTRIEVPR
jgi:hypothetical protein